MLVWGVTAPLQGMWQDDTALLAVAMSRLGQGLAAAFGPSGAPLRRLYDLPYYAAMLTPHPIYALQLLHGAFWLGQALAAGWIAGLLLPRRPLIRLVVVALTLTASSDYLTANLTALGYNFAVLTLLLAIGCGLRFVDRGGPQWLAASAAALGASLWTIDVAIPALVFLPLLVAWKAGLRPRARPVALLLAWAVVVGPTAVLEWRFLRNPHSYAAVALLPLPPGEIVRRGADLWYENFLPWHWALAHPQWYPRPPAIIRGRFMALAGVLAAAAFAWRARRLPPETETEPAAGGFRDLVPAALLALMALVANTAYASLQLAEFHYRTHVISRIWASIALGILTGWAAARWPRLRLAVLAVPALFVGFGVWGSLERQDLFLSTWRLHQRELLSIAASAPAIRDGTEIVLRGDPSRTVYLATQADYLTQSWLTLIYRQPRLQCLRLSPSRGTGCLPTPRGLDCWHEGQRACVAAHTCPPAHFDYDRLLVLDYDDGAGGYRLRPSLAGDPLAAGAEAAAAAYQPEARILSHTLSVDQRRLLLD